MSERREIGNAGVQRDGTASTFELLHPKCPQCGYVFNDFVLLPWDSEGVFAAGLVELGGEYYVQIVFAFECACGYVVRCELRQDHPPHWWGQMGEEVAHHRLSGDDYVAGRKHPSVIGADSR